MKTQFGFWRKVLFVLGGFLLLGLVYAMTIVLSSSSAQTAVERTRRALRQQGFKTDLADFNFSVPSEERGFELALGRAAPMRAPGPQAPSQSMQLMGPAGSNTALIAWKEDAVRCEPDFVSWDDFENALEMGDPEFVALRAVTLAEPIRFNLDASRGAAVLLPHLPSMRRASFAFSAAMIAGLHDGHGDEAWTNLLAVTRLVTAWEPEASEVSHMVRFALMTRAYESTWEALQDHGWPDEQLARLQREWEGVDFFKSLPEAVAFSGASAVDACERQRKDPVMGGVTIPELLKGLAQQPQYALPFIKNYWSMVRYRSYGTYQDEKALLLFYRDRQEEMRQALQATSWVQMSKMPGVTSNVLFFSKFRSPLQPYLNLRAIGMGMQAPGGMSFLARASETEERRRLIVTAIALERFRIRNGKYPASLGELTPMFLRQPAIDFMDGQPLRYRLGQDGRFLLYSVGLDGVDDGGMMPHRVSGYPPNPQFIRFAAAAPVNDIVWPEAANAEETATLHEQELRERQQEMQRQAERESDHYWERTARRQIDAAKTLASPPAVGPDLNLNGRPLSELLRNPAASGTNTLTLGEMLTLRPIITGQEPEIITFEAPINYDAATNLGTLALYIDSFADDGSEEGAGVGWMECSRATNGDCLVAWHAIFETPGNHTLLMGLEVNQSGPGRVEISGPPWAAVVTNICQFSISSATFDTAVGASLMAKLPELKGDYSIDILTTDGKRVKTINGSTSNGMIDVFWDLIGDDGKKLNDQSFNTIFHITLTESGRTQTLKGP